MIQLSVQERCTTIIKKASSIYCLRTPHNNPFIYAKSDEYTRKSIFKDEFIDHENFYYYASRNTFLSDQLQLKPSFQS